MNFDNGPGSAEQGDGRTGHVSSLDDTKASVSGREINLCTKMVNSHGKGLQIVFGKGAATIPAQFPETVFCGLRTSFLPVDNSVSSHYFKRL